MPCSWANGETGHSNTNVLTMLLAVDTKAVLDHKSFENAANYNPLFEIHNYVQGFERSSRREIWLRFNLHSGII